MRQATTPASHYISFREDVDTFTTTSTSSSLDDEAARFLPHLQQSRANLSSLQGRLKRFNFLSVGAGIFCVVLAGVLLFRYSEFSARANPASRKALVISTYSGQDISWTSDLPTDWHVVPYSLDDPTPSHNLTVPRNQGREAMAYLTYIIENYHDLPNYIAFVHGHARSWHQTMSIVYKIRALNFEALSDEHWISFRCPKSPGCDAETALNLTNPYWDILEHMPGFLETVLPEDEPLPTLLMATCCAQFAVARESIIRRPLDFWIGLRAPLLRDLSDYKTWGSGLDNYGVGVLFERSWHIFFGKDAVNCPSEEHCHRVHFSNAIHCNQFTTDWLNETDLEAVECFSDLSGSRTRD